MADPESLVQEKLSPDEWERFRAWVATLTYEQYSEAIGYAIGFTKTQPSGEATLPDDLTEMLLITKHQRLQ